MGHFLRNRYNAFGKRYLVKAWTSSHIDGNNAVAQWGYWRCGAGVAVDAASDFMVKYTSIFKE